jgi:hypothetical protein
MGEKKIWKRKRLNCMRLYDKKCDVLSRELLDCKRGRQESTLIDILLRGLRKEEQVVGF